MVVTEVCDLSLLSRAFSTVWKVLYLQKRHQTNHEQGKVIQANSIIIFPCLADVATLCIGVNDFK